MPNLITDRGFWVAGLRIADNVRRLMYQTLIWAMVAGDDPRGLGAPLDAEDRQGLPDSLVDGVRRDFKLGGDFLRRQQLIDEQEGIELTAG